MLGDVYVEKHLRLETLTQCDVPTLCDVDVLTLLNFETLCLDTLTLGDATLCDVYVVLCYVLSQYLRKPESENFVRRVLHSLCLFGENAESVSADRGKCRFVCGTQTVRIHGEEAKRL